METEFEYGDVVDCNICTTPMEIIIFGELNGPKEHGTIYVGGNLKTAGIAIKGHYLSKTGVNVEKADKWRERYIEMKPGKLKELSD